MLHLKNSISLCNLATLTTLHSKDHTKAKRYYRESIRLNNLYLSPKLGLAKLLLLYFEDAEEAKELLLDAHKIEPNNQDVLIHLSIVYDLN